LAGIARCRIDLTFWTLSDGLISLFTDIK